MVIAWAHTVYICLITHAVLHMQMSTNVSVRDRETPFGLWLGPLGVVATAINDKKEGSGGEGRGHMIICNDRLRDEESQPRGT